MDTNTRPMTSLAIFYSNYDTRVLRKYFFKAIQTFETAEINKMNKMYEIINCSYLYDKGR